MVRITILAIQCVDLMYPSLTERSDALQRNVKITNRIALVFAVLALGLVLITIISFGFSVSTPFTLLTSLTYLLVIFLNQKGFINLGRILLCGFMPIMTMCITLLLKKNGVHTDILYYDSRIVLMVSGLIPCLVFRTSEPVKLFAMITLSFACVILFDPIHEAFHQGYYQKGFSGRSYYYINVVSMITFLAISAGGFILKMINEKAEAKNEHLIREAESANQLLKEKNEELSANQKKIEAANTVIKHQRNELSEHNRQLEKIVQEKSQELIEANDELIKHNHELQQFSYTISHNLRAPIARMLGLTNLLMMQREPMSEELQKLIGLVQDSSLEFDMIIRDLNKIIDVRNEFYRIKEKINFGIELQQVKRTVGEAKFTNVTLTTDFQEPIIYTVRPILNSVLYNMVSNALKYKSTQRDLELIIRTYKQGLFIVLEVSDNGMGMNLDSYGQDVFGLYKRFHAHIEGRGIGLYLVKSQIESLGGKIEIKSRLNVGTSFYLYFKTTTDIDGQVILNNDFCTLFYNAKINALGIIWKTQPTSEQYRKIFNKSHEMMMLYHTSYWLADMRLQGIIDPVDQQWLFREIIPSAVRHGLKKVLCIRNPEQSNETYRVKLKETSTALGIDTLYFDSLEQAETWIDRELLTEEHA